ncbi:MAG: ABC transporter substrate-binding protein [Desulfobacterales bacterium]|nr:ABC transporter substrate-binding protein [Desulfobacterales bacterium]
MKLKNSINFLFFLFLSIILIISGCSEEKKSKNPLYLAVAGPMTGKDAPTGKSIAQAVQLYLDEINEKGGINGRKVLLDIYDDRNDKQLAQEAAKKIIADGRALGVIGHHYSSCSISAGKVYKEFKIPAITPVSTNINVTPENGWYFRTVFNDKLQGEFLANYVNKIFRVKTVSVITEELPYGSYLAEQFTKESKKLGTEIKHEWKFKVGEGNLDARLEEIVSELKQKKGSELIFLSMHAPEGARIIKLMKDKGLTNKVLCPDAFASKTFPEYFNSYPKEQFKPGYYTDGIHVVSPLLFDDADESIQEFKTNYMNAYYNEEPGWRGAFAYDAAKVILSAVKNLPIGENLTSIKKDRRAIKDYLAKIISINDAIKGVTGYNYFDKIGDSPKIISMGVFKNSKIVSALTQLQEIKNLKDILNLDKELKDETIIIVDGRYLYKTNVVYTGVKINKISEIDTKKLTCFLDFFVWFRFQNDFETKDIEFLNQVEKISLGPPVKEIIQDELKYRRYRVRGRFHMDSGSGDSIFGKYTLPIRFHHKEINRNNLKLVSDIVGMGLSYDADVININGNKKILKPSTGWGILNTVFFQTIVRIKTLGNPEAAGGSEEYSQFNAEVIIKRENISLRGLVPANISIFMCLLGCFLLIPIQLAEKRASSGGAVLLLCLKGFVLMLTLLSGEIALVSILSGKVHIFTYQFISRMFDIFWWIIPAYLLTCLLEYFIWRPVEKRTEQAVPGIVRKFTNFIIYVAAISCIIAFVYDQKITSLLATSGVVAMIIGLAIQINISNIFSGIALNLERPFSIGDWVKIDDFEGRVIDITWRTTRIQKVGGSIECIPNAMTSETVIRNYYLPQKQIEIYYTVYIPTKYDPDRAKKILLDALFACDVILQKPQPEVSIKGITEMSAVYGLSVTMEKYDLRWKVRNAVWSSVWEHLHNAGITPAIQNREIHIVEDDKKVIDVATPSSFINQLRIFMPFPPEIIGKLSNKITSCEYVSGDKIASIGDEKDSLFIVAEGVLGIYKDGDKADSSEISRLGVGAFFGELLTGKPRKTDIKAISDSMVFEITKEDLQPFVEEQPDFLTNLSNMVAERMKAREIPVTKVNIEEDEKKKKNLFETLLGVFGLKKI